MDRTGIDPRPLRGGSPPSSLPRCLARVGITTGVRVVTFAVTGLLMSSPQAATDADGASFIVPTVAELLARLDLATPGLTEIKARLDAGRIDDAATAYIQHFRNRAVDSSLFVDWSTRSRSPGYDTSRADQLLEGHLWDGYSVYDAPATGLDWHDSPLSCVTRFPIFGVTRHTIHHTRDPKYVRFVIDHILGYMEAYPITEFVGKNTRQGWTNHTTVAKPWYWCMIPERLSELSETVALIRTFPEVSDGELLRILHRMFQETAYLRTEIRPWVIERRHNGGCAMIEAMARASAVLVDFPASREWLAYAATLTASYIDAAFYPDGMCVELTTAYSASVSVMQQRLAYLLREEDAVLHLRGRLENMITCLVALSDPTGQLPSFGDLYAGQLGSYVHLPLAEWLGLPWAAARARRKDGPSPPFTVWPRPGQEQWCGYYAMRSGWNPTARYLAIDGGPWGTTHQHGDKLSFVVTAYGAKFIIDPSSTRYASNKPDAFIGGQPSAFLHNTITIDGVDEFHSEGSIAEAKQPLANTWVHGQRYSLFAGTYTFRPVKAVNWERRVLFVGGEYWLLQDVLTGDLESVEVEQNFQFEADIEIDIQGQLTRAKAPNGARLLLRPFQDALAPSLTIGDKTPHTTYWASGKPTQVLRREDGHDQKHGRGWTGRSSHRLIPAPAVTYSGRVSLPAVLTVAIVPLPGDVDGDAVPGITSTTEGASLRWTLPCRAGSIRLVLSAGRCQVEE